jgi:hypothetical protein
MKIVQTESADITTFAESGWIVVPLNVPVLLVEPPGVPVELRETEEEEFLLGDVDFVPATGGRYIDMLTHRALLDESVVKHKEIWKAMAKK